ncbi:DUF4400 domain-containing protein [Vibrio sp. PNB22_3_1]
MPEDKKPSSEPSRGPSVPSIPIVSYVIRLILRMFFVSLFAGFICLVVEFGIFALNKSEGYGSSMHRYQQLANTVLEQGSEVLDEASVVVIINDKAKVFIASLINQGGSRLVAPDEDTRIYGIEDYEDALSSTSIWIDIYSFAPNLTLIWIFTTLAWCVKMLTVLSMFLPGLFIVMFGFADGLARRKIATYQGERDSIDRHEYWAYLTRSVFYLVLFFYLAIPNGIVAYVFMLPLAVILAFGTRQVVRHFKKY